MYMRMAEVYVLSVLQEAFLSIRVDAFDRVLMDMKIRMTRLVNLVMDHVLRVSYDNPILFPNGIFVPSFSFSHSYY